MGELRGINTTRDKMAQSILSAPRSSFVVVAIEDYEGNLTRVMWDDPSSPERKVVFGRTLLWIADAIRMLAWGANNWIKGVPQQPPTPPPQQPPT